LYDDTKHGLILIGIGFLAAVGFTLGIYAILVIKTGLYVSGFYSLIFGLIAAGVLIGTIGALLYGAMDDEWIVAGWVYLILIIIFGIIGIALTVLIS
jgi:hypothetical protein